ncbi:MAG: DUF523 domain-containing protein [Bacillota bacterium]|nr:DUF523 domain-containing protein [Bacillota bacterium]
MILVSACLVGENCKYDGGNNYNQAVVDYLRGREYIAFCPELTAGLDTPRQPCEIIGNGDGAGVVIGMCKVINNNMENLSSAFVEGARQAYRECQRHKIQMAILKDKSPSCGVYKIYDGSFSHKLKRGMGVTASLLNCNHILVKSEEDIEKGLTP